MSNLDTGTYGAKVQSWRKANPRDLLKRIMEESPRSTTKDALLKDFTDRVFNDPDGEEYLKSVIEYWFTNNYHSLMERPTATARATQKATVEAVKGLITTRIKQEAKIILMDMVLPNGKALKGCTGKECRVLSKRVGAWLLKIANQLKPSEVVGDHLSEDVLQRLYSGQK